MAAGALMLGLSSLDLHDGQAAAKHEEATKGVGESARDGDLGVETAADESGRRRRFQPARKRRHFRRRRQRRPEETQFERRIGERLADVVDRLIGNESVRGREKERLACLERITEEVNTVKYGSNEHACNESKIDLQSPKYFFIFLYLL